VAVAIVAGVYGVESLATDGRVWQATFVAAKAVGEVHPADWYYVGILYLAIAGGTTGLILLLAAAGLSSVAAGRGISRTIVTVLGTIVIALILVMLVLQNIRPQLELGALKLIVTFGVLLVVIPVCAMVGRSSFLGGRLDAGLWVYLAGEVGLFTVLSRMSTGSWSNYAIQSVVFMSVLTARAVARVVADASSPRILWPVALAVLGVLASTANALFETGRRSQVDRAAVAAILTHVGHPPSAVFFSDRPGLNRVNGRLELVYDAWLYPVFEHVGLAVPRSQWLGPALASDPIRVVVNPTPSSRMDGVASTLHALGYRQAFHLGSSFYVWTR
jgi:hypothetical protein